MVAQTKIKICFVESQNMCSLIVPIRNPIQKRLLSHIETEEQAPSDKKIETKTHKIQKEKKFMG